MVGEAAGARPETIGVVTGDGVEHLFRTAEFSPYYRQLRAAYLKLIGGLDPEREPPEPGPHANHRRWTSHADHWLDARDHLMRVAGITAGQIRKLREAGITTPEELAGNGRPKIANLPAETFRTLKRQARIQLETRRGKPGSRPAFDIPVPDPEEAPRRLALLPPSSARDV